MTPHDYWWGWAAVLTWSVFVLYWVVRLAVRHGLKDHDRDAGVVRR
jgi:hypothetical protein